MSKIVNVTVRVTAELDVPTPLQVGDDASVGSIVTAARSNALEAIGRALPRGVRLVGEPSAKLTIVEAEG